MKFSGHHSLNTLQDVDHVFRLFFIKTLIRSISSKWNLPIRPYRLLKQNWTYNVSVLT